MGRDLFYMDVSFLLLSAILFWKFTSQASGQELIFPWSYFLTAAAGVLAIVLVTMIYTMRKIRKFNIIDELRMA